MTRPGYSPTEPPGNPGPQTGFPGLSGPPFLGPPFSGPPLPGPPGRPASRPRRRWWLIGVMVAWVVVLAVLGLWSVRHDPPTVPEQRTIAEALPVLERATGAVLSAADGPGRAVRLEALKLERGCRLTPVRHGMEATRDVTVFVQADQARTALDAIAKGLPSEYQATVSGSRAGGRVSLHADAGSYVGIDADVLADAQVLTVETSTGCRPSAAPNTADPRAGDPPPALADVERALYGTGTPTVYAVACGDGRTVATYTVNGLPRTSDLGRTLEPVTAGAMVILSDPTAWAYRTGDISVVVNADPASTKVSATTPCR